MQSRHIASICPGSPAEALGIQPDWQILQVDGEAPTVERLNRARIEGLRSLHLYDPAMPRSGRWRRAPTRWG